MAKRLGVFSHRTADLAKLNKQLRQEIAERKRAHDQLQELENLYRTTIDSVGDALHVVDSDLRFVVLKKKLASWCEELGLAAAAIGSGSL